MGNEGIGPYIFNLGNGCSDSHLSSFPWECIAGIQCIWGYKAFKARLNLVSTESLPLFGM